MISQDRLGSHRKPPLVACDDTVANLVVFRLREYVAGYQIMGIVVWTVGNNAVRLVLGYPRQREQIFA